MPVTEAQSPDARSLLREEVFARLRDAITEGELPPGRRVRDQDLARWLGVSRTPVREALLRLAEMGLVVSRPSHSTIVSDLDQTAVRDARDVVAAMHSTAVLRAVPKMTEADLEEMEDANRRFLAALREGDLAGGLKADLELHDVAVRVHGNAAVRDVLEHYTPTLRRAELLLFASLDEETSMDFHARLLAHCRDGDALAAARVVFDGFAAITPGVHGRRPRPQGVRGS